MSSPSSSEKSRSILNKLARKHRGFTPLEPIELLISAVLQENADDPFAVPAIEALRQAFVDWNEVRVARIAELARVMQDVPNPEARARRLRETLNALFDLRGSMDLLFLKEVKPAEGRRHLLELNADLPRPLVALILFALSPGTTIPISVDALRLARKSQLVSRSGSKLALQKALLAELSSEEAARLLQYLEYEVAGGTSRNGRLRQQKTVTTRKKSKLR